MTPKATGNDPRSISNTDLYTERSGLHTRVLCEWPSNQNVHLAISTANLEELTFWSYETITLQTGRG